MSLRSSKLINLRNLAGTLPGVPLWYRVQIRAKHMIRVGGSNKMNTRTKIDDAEKWIDVKREIWACTVYVTTVCFPHQPVQKKQFAVMRVFPNRKHKNDILMGGRSLAPKISLFRQLSSHSTKSH